MIQLKQCQPELQQTPSTSAVDDLTSSIEARMVGMGNVDELCDR